MSCPSLSISNSLQKREFSLNTGNASNKLNCGPYRTIFSTKYGDPMVLNYLAKYP
jgi:hypothetical protein